MDIGDMLKRVAGAWLTSKTRSPIGSQAKTGWAKMLFSWIVPLLLSRVGRSVGQSIGQSAGRSSGSSRRRSSWR